MRMLKKCCLTLLHIIALFHDVQMERCSMNISFVALTNDNSKTTEFNLQLTKRLYVNCSINVTASSEWENVNNIILYHFENNVRRRVARIDYDDNNTDHGSSGAISQTSESFLTREWSDPEEDKAGVYQCVVNVKLKTGEVMSCSVSRKLSATKPECVTSITIEAVSKTIFPENSKMKHIVPGVTKTLKVRCDSDVRWRKNGDSLLSIGMHFTNNPKMNVGGMLAFVDNVAYSEYDKLLGKGVGLGKIYKEKEGELVVEWPDPDFENAGKYSCQSTVKLRSNQQPEFCIVHANISAVPVDSCATVLKITAKIHNKVTNTYSNESFIRPGITDHITINCTLNNSTIKELDSLHTMNLLYAPVDSDEFQVLTRVNSSSKDLSPTWKNGLISDTSESYLYATRTYPDTGHEGTYKCEAIGTSLEGNEQKCSVSINISSVPKENCYTSMQITASPNEAPMDVYVEPGSTKKLIIYCNFEIPLAPAMSLLESLTLLRYDSNSLNYLEVASIGKDNQLKIKDPEAMGNGAFSERNTSYIYLEWDYPGYGVASRYKCEAKGISYIESQYEKCCFPKNVSLRELSLKALAQGLRSYSIEIMHLNKTLNLLKGKITELKEEIASEKKSAKAAASKLRKEYLATLKNVFAISNLYKRRRYYLAKSAALVCPQLAQNSCDRYGGYLAEIGDEKEFNFVRKFLKTTNGKRDFNILISGSDDFDEGTYLYARNNKEVTYLPWGQDQPDGGEDQNCLYLQFHSSNWNFFDMECVRNSSNAKLSYLCEFEEK